MDHSSAVDEVVAGLLRPLVDQDLSLVFYDLTTIRAAGLSEQDDDVRRYGMSKEGIISGTPVHAGGGANGRRSADLPRGV